VRRSNDCVAPRQGSSRFDTVEPSDSCGAWGYRPTRSSDTIIDYTRPGLDEDPAVLVVSDGDAHLGVHGGLVGGLGSTELRWRRGVARSVGGALHPDRLTLRSKANPTMRTAGSSRANRPRPADATSARSTPAHSIHQAVMHFVRETANSRAPSPSCTIGAGGTRPEVRSRTGRVLPRRRSDRPCPPR
jgi:hypothetical protein